MHRPLKHVIVNKNKAYLIDFERAHHVVKPKNVTQFCQFLIGGYAASALKDKKIGIEKNKLIKLAKIYKSNQNIKNFNNIIKII